MKLYADIGPAPGRKWTVKANTSPFQFALASRLRQCPSPRCVCLVLDDKRRICLTHGQPAKRPKRKTLSSGGPSFLPLDHAGLGTLIMSNNIHRHSGPSNPDLSQIDKTFARGVGLHLNGDLAGAERIYREILSGTASHVGALHLLSVVMVHTKRWEDGVALLDRALAIEPNFWEAHNNRGNALKELGRFDEAFESFDRAIAIKPDFAEAYSNRGVALEELGRLDEALANFDEAIRFDANYAAAHYNRGNTLREMERFDEALASFDQALAIRPNHADAFDSRGLVLVEMKRYDEALACFDNAIAIAPNVVDFHIHRGATLKKTKRWIAALASFDRVLALKADCAETLNHQGFALLELGRLEEALTSFDRALAIAPNFAEAHNNRGNALKESKRLNEAIASYERALSIEPDRVEAQANKALSLLLAGHFESGWKLNEGRKRKAEPIGRFSSNAVAAPLWSGIEPLVGRTLFVYWEQGLGDTIQFCRFAKLAEQRGAKVIFSVQNRLRKLLSSLSPTIEFFDERRAPDQFDYHCPLFRLPLAFQTTLDTIPADAPYLHAEPGRAAEWRDRLGGEGFKIGVAWQGNKAGRVDIGRSFALAEFLPLSRVPKVRLISLQKNDGAEQLRDPPEGMNIETFGESFDAGEDAFLDTAAMMANLDLVVTSDTSVAHLAGALGRPVWVLLKHVPDWRWMLDRSDSPWYPTMRLFRQSERGDWSGPFSEVERVVRELIEKKPQSAHAPSVPISRAT